MADTAPIDLSLFTDEELADMVTQVKADLLKRKTTITISFSGKNSGSQIEVPILLLNRSLVIELKRRDPDTYGYNDTRTSATFS